MLPPIAAPDNATLACLQKRRRDLALYTGCMAGALPKNDLESMLLLWLLSIPATIDAIKP